MTDFTRLSPIPSDVVEIALSEIREMRALTEQVAMMQREQESRLYLLAIELRDQQRQRLREQTQSQRTSPRKKTGGYQFSAEESRKDGSKGGIARAKSLSPARRKEIAQIATRTRWAKQRKRKSGSNDCNGSKDYKPCSVCNRRTVK
jgi:hypothetical protein